VFVAAPVIQANYDELQQVAQRFQQQAEEISAMLGRLRQASSALSDGGWQGKGSAAFAAEMEDQVLPATQRLITAFQTAHEVTLTVSKTLRAAEEEASRLFDERGKTGLPEGEGSGEEAFSLSKFLAGSAVGLAWQIFKDRNAWRALLNGVRFVKDANGMWRLYGSQAAKIALGLPKNLTRFGQAAIKKNLDLFSSLKNFGKLFVGDGPFKERAAKLIKGLTTSAPLQTAAGFLDRFKGAAGIDAIITIGKNVYEFGFGDSKEKGLGSREFVTATTADVSAGTAIVAASTFVGTLIPIPGVGTAIGFAAGVGLSYFYERYGKEAWRGVVDKAGQAVQEQASKAYDQASKYIPKIKQAGQDFINVAQEGGTKAVNWAKKEGGRLLGNTWNRVAQFAN
jgi:WXG100 family type VII secretion target